MSDQHENVTSPEEGRARARLTATLMFVLGAVVVLPVESVAWLLVSVVLDFPEGTDSEVAVHRSLAGDRRRAARAAVGQRWSPPSLVRDRRRCQHGDAAGLLRRHRQRLPARPRRRPATGRRGGRFPGPDLLRRTEVPRLDARRRRHRPRGRPGPGRVGHLPRPRRDPLPRLRHHLYGVDQRQLRRPLRAGPARREPARTSSTDASTGCRPRVGSPRSSSRTTASSSSSVPWQSGSPTSRPTRS